MLQPSTVWLHERMTWLTLISVPHVNMENLVSTMQALNVKSTASLPTQAPNRLRKRYISGKKTSLPFGIDVRRISEYEPISLRTRGTLGGFTSLSDLGGTDSDGFSLEKEKPKEKECCLTSLTKKIGLGVYVHPRRTPSPSRLLEEEEKDYLDLNGHERDTWYMFYPPPPSPSLAIESANWDSTSSDLDSMPQSASNHDSPTGLEIDDQPNWEATSPRESLYASTQSGSSTPDIPISTSTTETQSIHLDALDSSAEDLAQQYRDILPPSPNPALFSVQESAPRTEPQLLFEFSAPITTPPPKTIRKVKAQQSLRDIVDLRSQRPISSISSLSSLSFQATSSSIEIAKTTTMNAQTKRKRLSQRSQHPSPPPRESSLSFNPSSGYSYSPGHGPRRTHRRKQRQAEPNPLDEFEFRFAINAMESNDDLFSRRLHFTANSDGDMLPRPLALRRPSTGIKKPSPPPDPVRWEIPPVPPMPPVPSIVVSRPAETAASFQSGFRPRVPVRGDDVMGGGVMNPFDMTRLRDVEGGWI
jgi:hypothetical protein